MQGWKYFLAFHLSKIPVWISVGVPLNRLLSPSNFSSPHCINSAEIVFHPQTGFNLQGWVFWYDAQKRVHYPTESPMKEGSSSGFQVVFTLRYWNLISTSIGQPDPSKSRNWSLWKDYKALKRKYDSVRLLLPKGSFFTRGEDSANHVCQL